MAMTTTSPVDSIENENQFSDGRAGGRTGCNNSTVGAPASQRESNRRPLTHLLTSLVFSF